MKLVKAGLGESLIVSMVQNQPGQYSLTTDSIVKLKQAGVPEKVMAAMVAKGAGAPGPSAIPAPANAVPAPANAAGAATDIPQAVEIGVYFRKGGAWEEMLPEVVNWKTGGVLKHIASAGVVKGDVNGNIQSPTAETRPNPLWRSSSTRLKESPSRSTSSYTCTRIPTTANFER